MENSEILIKTLEKENRILRENLAKTKKESSDQIKKYRMKNEDLIQNNKELREELDSIIYSRSYKISQKIKKIVKR